MKNKNEKAHVNHNKALSLAVSASASQDLIGFNILI